MVLLAASVVTRNGRAVVSRQFVDMTRARIEGLLSAFPKLIPKDGGQHTFIETDTVRYVYQPIEKLYMVLITTKNSNILEDLETLRLFSRVIPEYCKTQDASDISEHAFELIFAFDEVVALGYKESVNLAQIRTFTEMESHEEKVAIEEEDKKRKDAKQKMLEEAKKIQARRREEKRGAGGGMGSGMSGFSIPNFGNAMDEMSKSGSSDVLVASAIPPPTSRPKKGGKGMSLRAKKTDDSFLDALASEGQHVVRKQQLKNSSSKSDNKAAQDAIKTKLPESSQEPVHIRLEEKITAIITKDGDIEKFATAGFVHLHCNEEDSSKVTIKMINNDTSGANLQCHPNIDKKVFLSTGVIGLKNKDKPFPVGQDVGVLKWRYQKNEEEALPIKVVCWPNDTGSGSCDVHVEYELQHEHLELFDVQIVIPIPAGCGTPVVGDCDGNYSHDSRKNVLIWNLPVIDAGTPSGELTFSMAGNEDDFFPVGIEFHSTKGLYTDIQVEGVQHVDGGVPAKYSTEVALLVEKFEIGGSGD